MPHEIAIRFPKFLWGKVNRKDTIALEEEGMKDKHLSLFPAQALSTSTYPPRHHEHA